MAEPLREDGRSGPDLTGDREMDAANRSLSDALRWSFRLLSVIMVFVVIGFLLSGFRSIESNQVGVKKVFGRVTGVARQGLAFTWPFPIGEIQIVDTGDQSLEVEDFWMHVTAEDRTTPLQERFPSGEGLRPGWDGALFTGDRSLLHVKMTCNYRVQDAVAYLQHVRETDVRGQGELRDLIRSALCNAAVRAAAARTASSVHTTGKAAFTEEVRDEAQRQLNLMTLDPRAFEQLRRYVRTLASAGGDRSAPAARGAERFGALLDAGRIDKARVDLPELVDLIPDRAAQEELLRKADVLLSDPVKIVSVSVTPSWPLRALAAYNDAQRARSQRQSLRDQAIAKARDLLRAAAEENYGKLVGDPARSDEDIAALIAAGGKKDGEWHNLIGQYEYFRDQGDGVKAAGILEQIDNVLLARGTGGDASKIIEDAKAEQTAFINPLKAWQKRFTELLPQYRRTPEILLTELWAETENEILNSPTNDKVMMNPGQEKTIYRIRQDPGIRKRIRKELLKASEEDKDKAQPRAGARSP